MLDCLIWALIALIVQVVVYFIVRFPVPNLSARIAAGELAPAIWLGLASLAAGALNAASMIYLTMAASPPRNSASAGRARRAAGHAAGEALRPCRAAGDGHARRRRRRLCADAAPRVRSRLGRAWRRTGQPQTGDVRRRGSSSQRRRQRIVSRCGFFGGDLRSSGSRPARRRRISGPVSRAAASARSRTASRRIFPAAADVAHARCREITALSLALIRSGLTQ